MPSAQTIEDVLNQLDHIIDECKATNSRLGLFAYVYRRTTAEIAQEIKLGNFEDNKRMEAFDITFAMLYLQAYDNHKTNSSNSKSWEFAFKQTDQKLTIIQHILFGMNAHINLDLAIATAQIMNGKDINEIKNDFNKVNDILSQITDELQDSLSRVSPLMFLLDVLGKNSDEKIIDFSMRKARAQAWNSANLLWTLNGSAYHQSVVNIDNMVLKLSKLIHKPNSFLVHSFLKAIQLFESNNVNKIILTLYK